MPSTYRLLVTFLSIVGLTLALTGVGHAAHGDQRERVIVALDDGVDPHVTAHEMAARHDGQVGFVYDHVLNGFSMEVPASSVRGIERDRRVRYVEYDQVAHAYSQTVPTGVQRIFADDNGNIDIDSTDDYRVDVDVAVIDTGIDLDHPDLNVVASTDCSGGSPFSGSCGSGGDDDNGHGTHVAGTIGAIDDGAGVVGVSPGARLHAVKVLRSDGSGYMSWIVAGIDYVTANAGTIEVANMSLGCECSSDSLDTAIADSVAAGVAYAVAAGNSDADASTFSPANHPDVLTVSALADFDGEAGALGSPTCRDDEDDTLANFSNFGPEIEIAAPGVCIYSTVPGGYDTYSGTSMASPHAAGALGLLASANNPGNDTDVKKLYDDVTGSGNFEWNDDSGDDQKEPLLDVSDTTVFAPKLVSGSGDGGGDTNSAPTASFTYSCTDLTCDFDGTGSSDSDGSISSYAWDFGDGNTATGSTATHTYASGGTYTVTLTVTDDDDATDTSSQDVSVSDSSSGTSTTLVVASETYSQFGGPQNDRHLDVTIRITDTDGDAISGATVTIDLYDDTNLLYDDLTGTTDSSGYVTYSFRSIGPGCYSADVQTVTKSGYTYDDTTDPTGDSCST